MNKVNLYDDERLDLPDVNAIQDLIHEYLVRILGPVIGPVSGCLTAPTFTYDSTNKRINIGSCVVMYAENTGPDVEARIIKYVPTNSYQAATYVDDPQTGGAFYIWAKVSEVSTEKADRKYWNATTGGEVTTETNTRTRDVLEFQASSGSPGDGWFRIGVVSNPRSTTATTGYTSTTGEVSAAVVAIAGDYVNGEPTPRPVYVWDSAWLQSGTIFNASYAHNLGFEYGLQGGEADSDIISPGTRFPEGLAGMLSELRYVINDAFYGTGSTVTGGRESDPTTTQTVNWKTAPTSLAALQNEIYTVKSNATSLLGSEDLGSATFTTPTSSITSRLSSAEASIAGLSSTYFLKPIAFASINNHGSETSTQTPAYAITQQGLRESNNNIRNFNMFSSEINPAFTDAVKKAGYYFFTVTGKVMAITTTPYVSSITATLNGFDPNVQTAVPSATPDLLGTDAKYNTLVKVYNAGSYAVGSTTYTRIWVATSDDDGNAKHGSFSISFWGLA